MRDYGPFAPDRARFLFDSGHSTMNTGGSLRNTRCRVIDSGPSSSNHGRPLRDIGRSMVDAWRVTCVHASPTTTR